MTVVSLAKWKEENSPHWCGKVKCIACKHEWDGVGEIGNMWVECPSCERVTGTPKYAFAGRQGDSIYTCNCGSEAMTVFYRGNDLRMICMSCGIDHSDVVQ